VPVLGLIRKFDILPARPRQTVDRPQPCGRDFLVVIRVQRQFIHRRRDVTFRKYEDAFVLDVDRNRLGIARTVRILEVDLPVDLGLVLVGARFFRYVDGAFLITCIIIANIGNQQVGIAIELERGEVFPVAIIRFVQIDPTEVPPFMVDRVEVGLATSPLASTIFGFSRRPATSKCSVAGCSVGASGLEQPVARAQASISKWVGWFILAPDSIGEIVDASHEGGNLHPARAKKRARRMPGPCSFLTRNRSAFAEVVREGGAPD
jgi:hypothetical protein